MHTSFVCYIHKPGVMTPELRVIQCETDDHYDLADALSTQIATWPDFELIEVYDINDKALLRLDKAHFGLNSAARRL